MSVRTADLEPARRRELWRHVVCDRLGPLDLRIADDAPLDGSISTNRLGTVAVAKVVTTTPQSVHRTPGHIRRDDQDVYRVVVPVHGRPRVAQDGRAAVVTPGEFTIYDFSRPYDLAYDGPVQLAVFAVPRALLPVRPKALAQLSATAVPATTGASALAVQLLRRVARDASGYGSGTAARLSSVVVDLLAAALAERLDQAAPPSGHDALRLRVQAHIDRHLDDPALTPAAVAVSHHVSPRTLHRLFAADQTTVGEWIRRRRLDRCRHDLTDPALGHLPVSAIGSRWAMPDPASFSRAFRRAYGMPPGDYRRRYAAAVADGQRADAGRQDVEGTSCRD